jgi:DNA mismatch repair ATPase MutS
LTKLIKKHEDLAQEYDTMQSDIVAQALEVASTYEHILLSAAGLLAEVDCLASLAHVAAENEWIRPEIIPEDSSDTMDTNIEMNRNREMKIEGLRHPVVEAQVGSQYVASDVALTDGCKVAIITGPNCGGKRYEVLFNQRAAYVGCLCLLVS